MESVIPALLGAALSAFVAYYIFLRQQGIANKRFLREKQLDDRRRLLEIRLQRVNREIAEFYGPLHSFTQQIFATRAVKERIAESTKVSPEQRNRIERHFNTHLFRPLHEEIQRVLQSHYYLAQHIGIESDITEFLEHSIQTFAQNSLYINEGIETHDVQGKSWPDRFEGTVDRVLKDALIERKELVETLEPSNLGNPADDPHS